MRRLRHNFSLFIVLLTVLFGAGAAHVELAGAATKAPAAVAVPNALSGTVTIRDVATRLCLDSDSYGDVYTLGCNGGNYQKWRVIYSGGLVTFRDVATNRCLDSDSYGDVYTLGCNGGNFQKWIPRASGGDLTFQNYATGLFLDSDAYGDVYTGNGNGGNFQKWFTTNV